MFYDLRVQRQSNHLILHLQLKHRNSCFKLTSTSNCIPLSKHKYRHESVLYTKLALVIPLFFFEWRQLHMLTSVHYDTVFTTFCTSFYRLALNFKTLFSEFNRLHKRLILTISLAFPARTIFIQWQNIYIYSF